MSTSLSNSACPNASRAPASSLACNVADRGGAAHLKAIAGQLEGVRESFAFVMGLLKNPDWSTWDESGGPGPARGHNRGTNGEEASRRLGGAVVMLRSALDAIAVMDNDTRRESERVAAPMVSFWTTDLALPGARGLQVSLRTRASRRGEADPFYLDFDGLASFWTRYYPGPLLPQDSLPHRDFFLSLGAGSDRSDGSGRRGSSGPVMRDLLLPARRAAQGLVSLYARHFDVPEGDLPGSRETFGITGITGVCGGTGVGTGVASGTDAGAPAGAGVCDALRRLKYEAEVYFDQGLVPTCSTNDVYTYTVPPNGDLVTRLTVRGSAIREVRVEIMGTPALTRAALNDTAADIPVIINMLRLGYHRATVRVTGADVCLSVTFKLLSDDAERARIATSEPLFAIPL